MTEAGDDAKDAESDDELDEGDDDIDAGGDEVDEAVIDAGGDDESGRPRRGNGGMSRNDSLKYTAAP